MCQKGFPQYGDTYKTNLQRHDWDFELVVRNVDEEIQLEAESRQMRLRLCGEGGGVGVREGETQC